MLKYKDSLLIIVQWLNDFESLFFLFILWDVKHHVNAKVSSTLYVSTPYTKEQHNRNTKHVEIIVCLNFKWSFFLTSYLLWFFVFF
jgi:hypothetical protein